MKQLPFLNDAADFPGADDSSVSAAIRAATPAVVDPRRPAIIVPVQVTSPEEIARQCSAIAETGVVDVIEWRIDPVIASIADEESGGSDAAEPPRRFWAWPCTSPGRGFRFSSRCGRGSKAEPRT